MSRSQFHFWEGMMEELFFARRPFRYGRYGHLSRGQVVELLGVSGDERLVRLGYLMKHDMQRETYECAECGARFIGISERSAHGRDAHIDRELTPMEEDARIVKQERLLEREAPIFFEKTAASLKDSVGTEIATVTSVQEGAGQTATATAARPPSEPPVTPGQVVSRPKRALGTKRQ